MREKFWELPIKALKPDEWEALCDGCGKCCLIRLEDEDTGNIYNTDVHCKLLDCSTCKCSDYENRKKFVPDCVQLTKTNVFKLSWLPFTCAYRLRAENKPLYDWHYLISGSENTVHEAGYSIKDQATNEKLVKIKNLPNRIKDWKGE